MTHLTTDPLADDRIVTTFDFTDAPPMGHTSVAFGGDIEQIDDRTFRLNWSDGISHWSEDLPTWHAAHAYLGHLIDYAFRGQYFDETVDEWLYRNWFPSGADWARWHYRRLTTDLESRLDREVDVEDMGGGMWCVLINLGDRFVWVDDNDLFEEEAEADLVRCYLYEGDDRGDPIRGYSEGSVVTLEEAVEMVERWSLEQAERDAVGSVLAQVEQFDLDGRQRVLVEALHEVNVLAREEG